MPVNLATPMTINSTIDAVGIDSFSVDLDRSEIVVGYTTLSSGAPVQQLIAVISGLDFAASIGRTNQVANGMPIGQVNVYGALKKVLYEYLAKITGLTGVVS